MKRVFILPKKLWGLMVVRKAYSDIKYSFPHGTWWVAGVVKGETGVYKN